MRTDSPTRAFLHAFTCRSSYRIASDLDNGARWLDQTDCLVAYGQVGISDITRNDSYRWTSISTFKCENDPKLVKK